MSAPSHPRRRVPAWVSAGFTVDSLRAELAPTPGRFDASVRMFVSCLLIVTISMTLQLPDAALSAYMVFFVSRRDMAATAKTAIALIMAITVSIALTLMVDQATFDDAPLRVALMMSFFCLGMFLSRVFIAGPLGFGIGFILLVTQSTVDLYPAPEPLLRDTLWNWMALFFSIATVAVVNVAALPSRPPAAPGQDASPPSRPPPPRPLFAADAFSNPAHLQFALKAGFAAMFCYIVYTALDWPGIHTCVITCAVVALTSNGASIHKASLRIAGALCGGALALLATVFIVPGLDSIGGLLLLIAPVVALSAWISAGSERAAYFGWQVAFAFFLCILHGLQANTDVTLVRDRLIGIVFGIVVMAAVFGHIWPEHARTGLRGGLARAVRGAAMLLGTDMAAQDLHGAVLADMDAARRLAGLASFENDEDTQADTALVDATRTAVTAAVHLAQLGGLPGTVPAAAPDAHTIAAMLSQAALLLDGVSDGVAAGAAPESDPAPLHRPALTLALAEACQEAGSAARDLLFLLKGQ